MAQAIDLPRNEDGIATALGILKQRFGDRFQTGQAIRDQHAHTTTWIRPQAPDAVVFPASTQEVSEIVKVCATHEVPIIAFGTGTSLEGHVNAPAGGVSVDMSRMDKIIAVNAEDLDCVVQPGVTREDLNTYLRDRGLFFPIDPGANASLGGMTATRASEPRLRRSLARLTMPVEPAPILTKSSRKSRGSPSLTTISSAARNCSCDSR